MDTARSRLRAALPRGQTLPQEQFETRHRVLTRLLWLHVAGLPIVAALYGYPWWHCLVEGSVVAVWAVAAQVRPGGRRLQAMVTAGGLMTCSAVLVHITGGLVEAHFHFFVLVTALALYEDWAVFLVAVGYVLGHHLLGAVAGMQIYDHGGNPWVWAAVHSGYIGALCVVNVIVWRSSERVRDELREARDDLARSNRELSQYAAVASHDLSEPLRTITGYLQLLDRRHGDALGDDGRVFLGYAVDGAARMRDLIDDLLTYSRVEQQPLHAVAVDLEQVLAAARHALGPAIADAGATVEHGPLPVVAGDPGQLGQLLQNLLANAVKFRRPDVAPVVRLEAERDGDQWAITVADNGIGIDPGHAERVFQMFQRLHTRSEFPGTGIGLAICLRVAQRHGGTLVCETVPAGHGSRFRLTLPAAAGELQPAAPRLALDGEVGERPLPRQPDGAAD